MMVRRSMVLALISCGVLGACGDSRGACTPGETQPCACTDGTGGSRVCDAEGIPGACTCAPPRTDAGSRDGGVVLPPDAGSRDAGGIVFSDSGAPIDAGGTSSDAVLGTGSSRDTLVAPDLSCRGTRVAPTTTGTGLVRLDVVDFFSDSPVIDLGVQVFGTDVPSVDGSCGSGCVSGRTDTSGSLTVTTSVGGWIAIRTPAGTATHNSIPEEYATVVQRHVDPSFGASMMAFRASTLNTLRSVLLVDEDPGTGIVMGGLRDCADEPIANAEIRVFAGGAPVVLDSEPSGPNVAYFNGEGFPNASERETNVDGLYGLFNIPVAASGVVRVEAWGRLSSGAAPQMIACEEGLLPSDGVAIIDLGPTRADGPSSCSM